MGKAERGVFRKGKQCKRGREASNSMVTSGKWEYLVQAETQSTDVDNSGDRAGQPLRGKLKNLPYRDF